MKEKMKRIEAMRELLDRLLEQNPDSENEIYDGELMLQVFL